MGLLSNGWLHNSNNVSFFGNNNFDCGTVDYFNQQHVAGAYGLPFSAGATSAAKKSAIPVGYAIGGRFLSLESGGMGSTNTSLDGSALMTTNLAAGINAEVTISCTGVLVASQLQTVISMAANLAASGTITNAQLVAFINMAASISATGTMTASIGAISNLLASITAEASMTNEMNAMANMEADITPFTELSPESLAAAVWNAAAASFNASGTMGQKLNGAGSAGDPWTTDLTSYTTAGTAGALMKKASKPKISL